MIVIDSSLWLEYFIDSRHSDFIESLFESPEQVIIPTIIITEIYKKILNDWDNSTANEFCSQLRVFNIFELNFITATNAAKFGKEFHLPLADSIIYASAMSFDAILYTMDKHFNGLKNVKYLEK